MVNNFDNSGFVSYNYLPILYMVMTRIEREPSQRRRQPLKENTFPEDPTDNLVELYLKEPSPPLLALEEEQELCKGMEKGKEAKEKLNNNSDLSADDKKHWERLAQIGQEARGQLIKANKGLVISIAGRHVGQGVPLLDLIQDGNIGLITAVDKFNHRRGYKLSTYATWWIRQAISRAVANQSRNVRLPVHRYEEIRKLNRTEEKLTQEFGRKPTFEELAEKLKTTPAKVERLIEIFRQELSLDGLIHPEDGNDSDSLGDFVKNEKAPQPEEVVVDSLRREKIDNALGILTPRERRIVMLRFGLTDGRSHTLQEVSEEFGLTRERIRQIEADALEKLRHPARSRKLRDLLTT